MTPKSNSNHICQFFVGCVSVAFSVAGYLIRWRQSNWICCKRLALSTSPWRRPPEWGHPDHKIFRRDFMEVEMKCERNQRLIILVIFPKNDEKLRSRNLSVVTPKLEASVYEKHAENRKSSAERERQSAYICHTDAYIIYREYRPCRFFACLHFTLDASPEDLIRRRQARKKAAAKKRFSFSKMDEQLDCDESAVNCDVMDLSFLVFFEHNRKRYRYVLWRHRNEGYSTSRFVLGSIIRAFLESDHVILLTFLPGLGPPQKRIMMNVFQRMPHCETWGYCCRLCFKCFKHPEWYGIGLLSSGIPSTLSALESRVAWPIFSQFGILANSTSAY